MICCGTSTVEPILLFGLRNHVDCAAESDNCHFDRADPSKRCLSEFGACKFLTGKDVSASLHLDEQEVRGIADSTGRKPSSRH